MKNDKLKMICYELEVVLLVNLWYSFDMNLVYLLCSLIISQIHLNL